MSICACIWVFVHVYAYMCMYMSIYAYIWVYVHVYENICACIWVDVHMGETYVVWLLQLISLIFCTCFCNFRRPSKRETSCWTEYRNSAVSSTSRTHQQTWHISSWTMNYFHLSKHFHYAIQGIIYVYDLMICKFVFFVWLQRHMTFPSSLLCLCALVAASRFDD